MDTHFPASTASTYLHCLGSSSSAPSRLIDPRMAEEDQNMDDILYRAAQLKGSGIPLGVNFLSRTSNDNNNVFHVAAQYDNHEFIKGALAQLGESGLELLCQKNSKDGSTPLHLAAQSGHMETIKALVEAHKGSVNSHICWRERDNKGDTPVHKALLHGHDEIAKMFLDYEQGLGKAQVGGLASIVNNEGESVAYLAVENYCIGFFYKIMDEYDPDTVSLTGYRGQTIFHAARRLNNAYMFFLAETVGRSMLKNQDASGKTVLHYVVEENKIAMVEELLKVETSFVYLGDNGGLTPLDVAFKRGLFPIVEIILKRSPQSVEIRDEHRRSPLHYTKMDGVFLRKLRTNIDGRILSSLIGVDEDGNTPLHIALINSEHDAAFELQMFKGCSWSLRNKDGYSPWNLCQSNDKIPHKSPIYEKLSKLNSGVETLLSWDWKPYWSFFKGISYIGLESMDNSDCEQLLDKIAVAAAFLIPLNFAAAFSVPGGYDSTTGKPVLRDHNVFHVYNASNMIAFLATVFILIICTFGVSKRSNKRRLVRFVIALLQIALFATLFAYVAGLIVTGATDPNHMGKFPKIILPLGCGLITPFLLINYFS